MNTIEIKNLNKKIKGAEVLKDINLHLELTEGYMEWGVVRFLITFVITYFLMSLMILIGIWFPARQVIRIQPAEALREE